MFKNLPATILVVCTSSVVFNSPTMLVPQVLVDPTLSWDFPIIGLVSPNREIGPAIVRQVSRLCVTILRLLCEMMGPVV